jgi:thymidylate synthase (FAD)
LMRHSHTTPFEMCEIKFHLRAPMDVWRQWIRHRTASVNEYSTRYSVAIDAAQKTAPNEWRKQSTENQQGSLGFLSEDVGGRFSATETEFQADARKVYEERLAGGVSREQARKDLPLSTYTEAYWKIDLHNLLHFLRLRLDSHAQAEIRNYAMLIGEQIVAKWVPVVWDAFLEYQREDLHLSKAERGIVTALIGGSNERARAIADANGWLRVGNDGKLLRNRERDEFESKLRDLGLKIPW